MRTKNPSQGVHHDCPPRASPVKCGLLSVNGLLTVLSTLRQLLPALESQHIVPVAYWAGPVVPFLLACVVDVRLGLPVVHPLILYR